MCNKLAKQKYLVCTNACIRQNDEGISVFLNNSIPTYASLDTGINNEQTKETMTKTIETFDKVESIYHRNLFSKQQHCHPNHCHSHNCHQPTPLPPLP